MSLILRRSLSYSHFAHITFEAHRVFRALLGTYKYRVACDRSTMNARTLFLCLTGISVAFAGTAFSQIQRPNVGPTNPDAQNRNLETMQEARLLNDQRRIDEEHRRNAQVAKFMKAIAPRKDRFPDFDQVVIHGKTPVSPTMLAIMADSPYAADIAYFLGKHSEQSGAIAQMAPVEAGKAMHQIEAEIAANNSVPK